MTKLPIWDISLLLIVIWALIMAKTIENKNGRIEMCQELGNYYLSNGSCISELEYNLLNPQPDDDFSIPEEYLKQLKGVK
jgi:hypothetical protein